jgi:hypothetical protein
MGMSIVERLSPRAFSDFLDDLGTEYGFQVSGDDYREPNSISEVTNLIISRQKALNPNKTAGGDG